MIVHVTEQETNDLNKAFRYCLANGWTDIVILGATGKREDHTLGNIGLLMAVEALEERDSLAAYQVQLMNAVNQHMQDVLQEQKDLRELGDGIAKRVTHLSQAIHNLEEDLEHKVSVEELSAYLEMPVQESRDILKMAGDELDVDGAEQG